MLLLLLQSSSKLSLVQHKHFQYLPRCFRHDAAVLAALGYFPAAAAAAAAAVGGDSSSAAAV
jgi:hypothetical protein